MSFLQKKDTGAITAEKEMATPYIQDLSVPTGSISLEKNENETKIIKLQDKDNPQSRTKKRTAAKKDKGGDAE